VHQRLHILGICGTFMGGLALLARELGWQVSGCDANVYPPMSEQLAGAGIALTEGYAAEDLPADALIVVGNALSRGNPAVEAVLDRGLPFTSGPQWLAEHVLAGRWVLAVAGTHGKTTTSSLLAWLLQEAGLEPGFLIGGVPRDFGRSARLGAGSFFVVEADEYDTAFFDKRAKFVHYGPRTLIINNLEFDHADIYPDLAAIQRQFHHLIRCVPGSGRIITPAAVPAIEATLAQGLWTPRETLVVRDEAGAAPADDGDWVAELARADGTRFSLRAPDGMTRDVHWTQRGAHNVANALAAVAAARHVGVAPSQAAQALASFSGVRRRLELSGEAGGVRVYDDFAHHPTAIRATLAAFGAAGGGAARERRLIAVIEPRSNTMRKGEHRAELAPSTAGADRVYWYQPPGLDWSLEDVVVEAQAPSSIARDIDDLVAELVAEARAGDDIVIMSNGAFGGIHQRLLGALAARG
jgi:UDP-N-acetylmuramate: L-alanyl-gamma-D-glutamyl-meso-diaminopimelate ligase